VILICKGLKRLFHLSIPYT